MSFVVLYLFIFFFFFSSRRRHTRFDCDWSSDVCSSDLVSFTTVQSYRSKLERQSVFFADSLNTYPHTSNFNKRDFRRFSEVLKRRLTYLLRFGIMCLGCYSYS